VLDFWGGVLGDGGESAGEGCDEGGGDAPLRGAERKGREGKTRRGSVVWRGLFGWDGCGVHVG
jgi:hypothetical protein